jgi:hypothetical protein
VAATALPFIAEVKDAFGLGAVEIHVEDDLALVASPVPDDFDLAAAFADQDRVAQIALAHHEILAEICLPVDLVPVRLGSAISGERAARQLIRDQASRFRASLRLISGIVEFAVVMRDSGQVAVAVAKRQIVASQTVASQTQACDGRGYLRARAAAVSEVHSRPLRVAATIQAVASLLSDEARSYAARPLPRPEPAEPQRHFDATYLVERARAAAFLGRCRTVPSLISDQQLSFTVRGPWPAYSLTAEVGSLS